MAGLISSQGCTLTEQEAMGICCLRGILYEDNKCFTVGTIMFPRNVTEPVLPEKFKTQPDKALEWCTGKPNLKLSFNRRLDQVSSGSLFQPRFFYSSMILQWIRSINICFQVVCLKILEEVLLFFFFFFPRPYRGKYTLSNPLEDVNRHI